MSRPIPISQPQGLALFPSSFARLPASFYERRDPAPVAAPRLVRFNHALARELNLDVGGLEDGVLGEVFSGNRPIPGALPIALGYAGHQFGSFVPQLGDGRAVLLGEAQGRDGRRYDIQLKGAGRTRYSRGGDGRAALGPVLREYLVSEAMHALGVPTTRALAAVTTGEAVQREELLPGAVLARVAASHVRVGTFQFIAARDDTGQVKQLADHVIDRTYPAARAAANPYLALLQSVVERQAELIARWMHIGFIHGVMNTDNMAVSGETIDYGPCAFMDAYDPGAVYSAIDQQGRYAFANQPPIAQWNLARFAETLLPLLATNEPQAIDLAGEQLSLFATRFRQHWLVGMRAKLGLTTAEEGDLNLIESLLALMHAQTADYTLTFRRLSDAAESPAADAAFRALFAEPATAGLWLAAWRARLAAEPVDPAVRAANMRRTNPLFIPRNHRIEQALRAAIDAADFAPFLELLGVLAHPFESQPDYNSYSLPPTVSEQVTRTYCGT